jgi:hypothetical protein
MEPMPKYLLIINESEAAYETGDGPGFDDIMAMHMAFATEVAELGGTNLGGEALQPLATATFLRGTRTDGVTAVDNPAPDLKETLGGYYLVEAPDDATARRIAERCPAPYGHVELRPIWDFTAG